MNIFGIGLPEMAVIMVVALLVFGPKKLPEIGRSLGKTLRSFQDASKEFETEFKKEAQNIEKSVKMNAQLESTKEQPEVSQKNSVSVEQNSQG
ncbi:Sec-independent protein translocase protein TatA [Hyella patelloides LEGE 07179]|uniref:Sec-independent protein translocase protein TatA n=1 Tax=Hyella patelloides LEGE 07179 TaxID=945734 RepID=A0A563VUK9_9CYAN|nr:TatA/E family twin arginine-targeting protein translocase [Hyella patelloides]VEP15074.1 Sec-independent protein translocase protein TatA [Hyella patelloides LEGE 07179]